MLGSIEKGRKWPQFGRRHNVTFFNKMYPLSWLALMQPKWAFHCILSVTLPAREGSWPCVPGVTKSLCVPTRFSHSSEGLRGELLCYFSQVLSQMFVDRRPEGLRNAAGPGWRQQCHMPMGAGGRGGKQFRLREPSDWLFPGSDSKKPSFQGTCRHPWLEWKGRSERRKTRFGRDYRSQKPLDRSVSGPGLHWFPWQSNQWSGQLFLKI